MLDRTKARITHERSSRTAPMEDADVRELLASVDVVVVARGKKAVAAAPGELSLQDLKGPTGNYRAPMLVVGRKLLVGFHPATLEALLGGRSGPRP